MGRKPVTCPLVPETIGVELLAGLEIEPPAWVLFLIEGALALVAKEVLRNAGC